MNNSTAETIIETSPTVTGKSKSSFWGWVRFIVLLGLVLFFFRFVIGVQMIDGNSMNPTIENGNAVLINKMFYEPEKGDIVLVKDHYNFTIIKRVIATGNDTVSITNGVIYVNGVALAEHYTIGQSIDVEEIVVPEGEYFIVGDNRTQGESLDSRDSNIGTFKKEDIIGEAMVSLFPPGKF